MTTIDQIRGPIEGEFELYKQFATRHMSGSERRVGPILEYALAGGGKGIRPVTVLLSAAMHTQNIEQNPAQNLGERAYLGAMLVEMVHTASLVHDDVIDRSDLRRGRASVRAVWGSRGAVIAGDLILARSIAAGLESAHYDIVGQVVAAMSQLCEGELIQSEQSRHHAMTREIYLDIVGKKTAVLFGVSASVGALAVGASNENVQKMRELGNAIGVAFQIRDDILDYAATSETGKPACNDLMEGKITLPLLAVLERSSQNRRAELLAKLSNPTSENIDFLHDTVIKEGGPQAASQVMRTYVERAHAILAAYPASPYRDALSILADYSAERRS